MSGTENNSVNRMKNAEERLARAIGRLEAALDSQVHAQADAPNAGPGLADELSRLQADNAELRALVGRASERLDGTIAKLKSELSS